MFFNPMPKKITQITGVFERIVWRSRDTPEGETPYVIGKIDVDGEIVGFKGNADPAEFLQGVSYIFQGYMETDPRYGRTIKFMSWRTKAPHSRRGLTLYLQRNCEGIGAKRASDMYDAFGHEAVAVLRNEPKRVFEALRGAVKLEVLTANSEKLKGDLKNEEVKIELIDLLAGRGFRQMAIDQCIQRWGLKAPEVIQENPFQLMQWGISGAGFLRCDKLYLDLGHDPAAIVRQVYCLQHAIKSDMNGHTWIAWRQAVSMLNQSIASAEVDGRKALAEAVSMGLVTERKEGGQLWVADATNARSEKILAAAVRQLMAVKEVEVLA